MAAIYTPVARVWRHPNPVTGLVTAGAARHAAVAILVAALAAGLVWAAVVLSLHRLAPAGSPARGRVRSSASAALVALGVAAAVAIGVNAGTIEKRVHSQYEAFVQLSPGSGGSRLVSGAGNRYDYWRVALIEFRSAPVGGVGAGNYDTGYYLRRRTTEAITQPHSLELQRSPSWAWWAACCWRLSWSPWFALSPYRSLRTPRSAGATRGGRRGRGVHGLASRDELDWTYLIPGVTAIALAAAVALASAPEARSVVLVGRMRIAAIVAAAAVAIAGTVTIAPRILSLRAQASAQRALDRGDPRAAVRPQPRRSSTTRSRFRHRLAVRGLRRPPLLPILALGSEAGGRGRTAQLGHLGTGRRPAHAPRRRIGSTNRVRARACPGPARAGAQERARRVRDGDGTITGALTLARRMKVVRFGVALVIALGLSSAIAGPAAAVEPGVFVDPGGPAGKEYGVPLSQLRGAASGHAPVGNQSPPPFGIGISPAGGTGSAARSGTPRGGSRQSRRGRATSGRPRARATLRGGAGATGAGPAGSGSTGAGVAGGAQAPGAVLRGSRATDLPCPPWPYSPAWSCSVAWGSAGCLSPRAVVWIESRARPCRQGFVARVNRDPRARGRPPGGARSALGSEGDLGAGDGGRKVGVPRLPHARRGESSKWT